MGHALAPKRVTVTGFNFGEQGSKCRFGIVLSDQDFLSSTQVLCHVPRQALAAVSVEVEGSDGHFSVSGVEFQYVLLPEIGTITPSTGPMSGGGVATIVGRNFHHRSQLFCTFGKAQPVRATIIHDSEVTCSIPPAEARKVMVSVSDNSSGSFNSAEFEYWPDRVILSVTPTLMTSSGQGRVTIYGQELAYASDQPTCTFGDITSQASILTSSALACQSPVASPGHVQLAIEISQGFYKNGVHTVEFVHDPVLISVLPSGGPVGGGTVLNIVGRHILETEMLCGIRTKFDIPAQFVSSSLIQCTTPPGDLGRARVHVSVQGTFFGGDEVTFEYVIPTKISSLHPSIGGVQGGQRVTVTGKNFGSTTILC
eukprot:1067413-Rhodomonas_salina.1